MLQVLLLSALLLHPFWNTEINTGSDTMATTMTATLFYLLHYPSTLDRLTTEITTTFSSIEDIILGPQLTSCLYLRACIDEALRLNPPVGGVIPREVLPGGITIDGNVFPPGTDIGTPVYVLQRQEKYFRNATSYEPERWLEGSTTPREMEVQNSAFAPFSLGPRGCPGKTMAYAEMTVTLARVVYLFEMRLEGGGGQGMGAAGEPVQFQTRDSFVSQHDGPWVQFRRRQV